MIVLYTSVLPKPTFRFIRWDLPWGVAKLAFTNPRLFRELVQEELEKRKQAKQMSKEAAGSWDCSMMQAAVAQSLQSLGLAVHQWSPPTYEEALDATSVMTDAAYEGRANEKKEEQSKQDL